MQLTGCPWWTGQDEQEAAERRALRRAKALDWLNERFSNVRDEEVSDDIARDIEVMQEWDTDCAYCTDIAKCRHSRAVLVIREEGTHDGWRTFVTRAKVCDRLIEYKEMTGMDRRKK